MGSRVPIIPGVQSRPVLAGRGPELEELLDGLAEASVGRGRLILLEGEPGIGKSRLADELASRARELGYLVLWGRGWEDAGAPPYWPWVQGLRTLVRSTPPDELRRQAGPGAADVAQMLPEIREVFSDLPAPRDADSDSARFQLFDSTATILRNAGRVRPLLVVLDDLHAADTASMLLLRFMASQLADMRVLIVGTYRDLALAPNQNFPDAIAELQREPVTRVIRIGGLKPAELATFIAATADFAPEDELVAAIWRATSGNPLFAGEAIRLLRAEGRLTELADLKALRVAVPSGVRAVIARRIGHLDAVMRRALALGAVLGPEFGLDVLANVAGLGADAALDLVDQASEAGLLLPVTGAAGRYRFSHDLVRETLYAELSPGRRARLHVQVGQVLEELDAARPDSHLPELAFHFVQAAQLGAHTPVDDDFRGLVGKAVDYARRAGDAATRSLAFEEAARLYRMALSVLDPDDPTNDDVRGETLLALGDALSRAADLDSARKAFVAAADIARRRGAPRQMARAALGYGGRHQWARAGNDTQLISLLEEALDMLHGSDERVRARLLTRLAGALRSSPEKRSETARLSIEATEIARGLDDPLTLSYAIEGQFWATWWPENPDHRVTLVQEMRTLAAELGDGERMASAQLMSMFSNAERGRMEAARGELDTLAKMIDGLRQPEHFWIQPTNRAWLALLDGDFELAERIIGEERQGSYQVTPARDDVAATNIHAFLLRREQGRVAEEVDNLRQAAEEFPWYPVQRAALTCALISVGRDADARMVFTDLARDDFTAFYRDNEWLLGIALASEACALLGDVSNAAVLYGQLQPFAGRNAMGFSEGSVGAVDRYLGLLAAAMGRMDDAVHHLEAAIQLNEQMGARPWAAHCRHDLAQILRRRDALGDRSRAAELEEAAIATARSIGMALREISQTSQAAPSPATMLASAKFQREGEYWTIEFGSEAFRLRDSKGMAYLAALLRSPGTEAHALDLAGRGQGSGSRGLDPSASLDSDALSGTGPILDAAAKAAYAERLRNIRAELAEAVQWNDAERVAGLQEEERFLAHELAAAMGLGGRDRVVGSAAERARVSVTRAIRSALDRIAAQSPRLGDHLRATIRTGTYCSYVPDPRAPIEWTV
jgi:tetratricopeptide (TPR) repeat protein